MQFFRQSLTALSVCINKNKSVLSPTKTINCIGALLDSISAKAFLPADRFYAVSNLISCITCKPRTMMHWCLSLLGACGHMAYVTSFTRLHWWCLQTWFHLIHLLSRDRIDSKVTITSRVLTSLDWWSNPNKILVRTPFNLPMLRATILMDASLTRWGTHLYCYTALGSWIS